MDLSNVITLLEEEKWESVEAVNKLKKERMSMAPFEGVSFMRKLSGIDSLEEDILAYERDIEELTEAIRILRLSSSEEG